MKDTTNLTAESILEQIISNKLAQASPLQQTWYAPETLRKLYQDELEADVERVFSDEMADKFHFYCPVPGSQSNDFKNKWLELPDLGNAIIGIRFWGLDLGRPFIAIAFSEMLLRDGMNIDAIKDAISDVYGLFQPKHLRFFLPSHWQGEITRWQGAHWEKRYLAAPITDMRTQPEPGNLERLHLQKPADMTFYKSYVNLYERRFEAFPLLCEYTRIEIEEDMVNYLEEGTLFEIYVDGVWAGVICVTKDTEQGLKGFLVIDIILEPHLTSQGFGVAAQYRLAQMLHAEDGDVLFGTIDARNTPALKTAKRSGRYDIGGFLWLPI